MTYPVGALLKAKKRWLTPNRVLLWSVTGGNFKDYIVRMTDAVLYIGEWESQSNTQGDFAMRHHFLTPAGVFGRDSHIFDWDCFAPVHEQNVV